jgi:hypothetical protein
MMMIGRESSKLWCAAARLKTAAIGGSTRAGARHPLSFPITAYGSSSNAESMLHADVS